MRRKNQRREVKIPTFRGTVPCKCGEVWTVESIRPLPVGYNHCPNCYWTKKEEMN